MFERITPLILTYNEAPNIGRTLEQLKWADKIVVVDSFSTDETPDIVRSFPQVQLIQQRFQDHTTQWNFGLDQVASDWVLSLDADYVLDSTFVTELSQLPLSSMSTTAWFAKVSYCIAGRRLRSSIYPPRAVLFRKSRCRYVNDGHTQVLQVNGPSGMLKSSVLHDDRKPLARWLKSQAAYIPLEAEKLLVSPNHLLGWRDRIRKKILLAPLLMAFYTLIIRRLLFDGWPGIYYSLQRVYAELLLSLELLDRRLNGKEQSK